MKSLPNEEAYFDIFWLLFDLVYPLFDICKYFKLKCIITQHNEIYIYLEENGLISDKNHYISDISDQETYIIHI